jgi:hypothetical protein
MRAYTKQEGQLEMPISVPPGFVAGARTSARARSFDALKGRETMSAMTDVRFQAPLAVFPVKKWKNTRWRSIKAALHLGKTSMDQASFHMLSLYRANLEIRLRAIDESSLLSDSQKKSYSTIAEMLKPSTNGSAAARNFEWDEIYKAESLIALLFSGAQLRQEIGTRLKDLAKDSPADADALTQDYEALIKPPVAGSTAGPDDSMLRMFLLRVMEAFHWNAKKKYLARPIRKEATNRILGCLLLSFAMLAAPYVLLNWGSSPEVSKWWSLFVLWTALTAGLLGAFFSRLIGVQRQWVDMSLDEVFLHREWPYTLLRAGVGVCGALIVYFFLRSGIADGVLFPNFDQVRIEYVIVPDGMNAVPMSYVMPSKSLALLTFWCFLAGFSESLVPSILSGTEQQLRDAAAPAQVSRK